MLHSQPVELHKLSASMVSRKKKKENKGIKNIFATTVKYSRMSYVVIYKRKIILFILSHVVSIQVNIKDNFYHLLYLLILLMVSLFDLILDINF
jgi:hypothetical protein